MAVWTKSDAGHRAQAPSTRELGARDGHLETIAEAIPGMLAICGPEGFCTCLSQQWLEYTGAAFEEAASHDGFSYVHPDDQAQGREQWKRAFENGQNYERELRLRRKDGVYRTFRVRGVPERDAQNAIKRWVVMSIDIEEQKQIRQESASMHVTLTRAKEELERTVAERTQQLQEVVEQLEAFAYSIAHDMRAPLRTMHQYAEMVTRDFSTKVPEQACVYLNKIMGAAEKLDVLIHEVPVYTRVSQGEIKLQPISLERLLPEILIMYPHLNAPEVELDARLPLHTVIGDETALTQTFSNLLTNAVKFVPKDRKPKVTIWSEEIGDKVRIFIKDNGIGIATRDQQRIFKMFERLQPESQYEGIGIGLTIVRRAVGRMGGTLGVESVENQGSTFWIELKKGEPC
jgi:PAS domain S-box-containing protein